MAGDLTVVAPGNFSRTAAGEIARLVRAAASGGNGPVTVALSGGGTPKPVYQELAALSLPWSRVEIWFADERAVPPEDPRSNYRLVADTLGSRLAGRPHALHRMEAERPDLEAAAAAYAASLPAELDLLVLGLGEDGHTASLFPGHPANAEERRVVAVTGPADPPRRMTITPPVIRAARATLMLVAGPAKAEAVARALEGPWDPAACPGQWARPGQWLLDDAAAARLATRAP